MELGIAQGPCPAAFVTSVADTTKMAWTPFSVAWCTLSMKAKQSETKRSVAEVQRVRTMGSKKTKLRGSHIARGGTQLHTSALDAAALAYRRPSVLCTRPSGSN